MPQLNSPSGYKVAKDICRALGAAALAASVVAVVALFVTSGAAFALGWTLGLDAAYALAKLRAWSLFRDRQARQSGPGPDRVVDVIVRVLLSLPARERDAALNEMIVNDYDQYLEVTARMQQLRVSSGEDR